MKILSLDSIEKLPKISPSIFSWKGKYYKTIWTPYLGKNTAWECEKCIFSKLVLCQEFNTITKIKGKGYCASTENASHYYEEFSPIELLLLEVYHE